MKRTDPMLQSEGQSDEKSGWYERFLSRFLGPRPGLKELNLLCWGLFVGFLIVPVFAPLWMQARSGSGGAHASVWTHLLPNDFIYFYGIGRLANQYPLVRLYDYRLQLKIFNEIFAVHQGSYGPSPYPPYVAMFFSLLARLSFGWAYLVWALISLGLYLTGVGTTVRESLGDAPNRGWKASLAICFAVGFSPFFFSTLANGQLAAIAVCSVGLAVSAEKRNRPLLAGLALSMLAYKPTLLLLIVPMLVLTRRVRMLGGFVAGTATLALIATAAGGLEIWPVYYEFLKLFRGVTGANGQSVLPLWEYVDFSSLSYAVPGGRSRVGVMLLVSVSIAVAAALAALMWKSARAGAAAQGLLWATTLTWTLLLNVYVPVWDSDLVVIAILLTLGALRELRWSGFSKATVVLALALFAVTWNSESSASGRKIEIYTALLTVLGVGEMELLRRAIGESSAKGGLGVPSS